MDALFWLDKFSWLEFLSCILLLLICIFYRLSSCFKSSSSRFRVWLAPVLINDKFLEELSIVVYCIYFLSDFNVFSMILFPMYFISPPSYSMTNSSEFTCEFSASMPKLMCLDIAVPESTCLLTNEEKTLLLTSNWFLNCECLVSGRLVGFWFLGLRCEFLVLGRLPGFWGLW